MQTENEKFLALLLLLSKGELETQQRQELEDYIKTDPKRQLLYRSFISDKVDNLVSMEAIRAYQQHHQKMIDLGLFQQGDQLDQTTSTAKRKIRLINPWIAACVVFVLLSAGGLGWWMLSDQVVNQRSTIVKIETKKGERKQIIMPDSTVVWLNSESSLTYDESFGKEFRRVTLVGEGYFDVAKNKNKPFNVQTSVMDIQVLGTIFNVRAYEDEKQAETTLIEGSVELSIKSKSQTKQSTHQRTLKLTPGQKFSYSAHASDEISNSKTSIPISIEKEVVGYMTNVKNTVGEKQPGEVLWRENKLVFDGDSMELLISKLEKWYGIDIILESDKWSDSRFSGVFVDKQASEILKMLQEIGGGFNYKVSEGKIHIY